MTNKENTLLFFSRSKLDDGKYLSNFSVISDGDIVIDERFPIQMLNGKRFHSVENAFQACKLAISNAPMDLINNIQEISPMDAKKMGSKTMFKKNKLVLDVNTWNSMSYNIMRMLIVYRFENDIKFREIIQNAVKNGMKLKHFDRSGSKSYWGGFYEKETKNWVGKNKLGEIMESMVKVV